MQQNELANTGPQQGESPEQLQGETSTELTVPLEQQLETAQYKAEEYLDRLRRTQADFVNYRRRVSQEQSEERTTSQASLLGELLPVLDDLRRALLAAPPELTQHPWVQGVFLVEKRLTTTLEQLGIRQIGTSGDVFNPHWHEALMGEPRQDLPEGTVISVVRPGYALRERVIRPAQVVIAQAPAEVQAPSTD